MDEHRESPGDRFRHFFATAAKGTEPALRDELRELRFRKVRADRGGVHFEGPIEEGYRACIELRTAVRVLLLLAEFDAEGGDALYEGVRGVDWSEWLTARHTLAVRASCKSSALTHSQFIAQRTKDAVVDQLREKTGSRPSVDRDDPDVLLFVHLVRDRASLYIDVSGESMHRRGYRTRIEDAPLKETLAASIVRLSGWDRKLPFVDPMCGSGTIAIEAALWAQDIAPGLLRGENGFERWASYDDTAKNTLRELLERAKANVKKDAPSILACDVSLDALATTRDNARRAGVSIRVARRSVGSIEPTNPPGFVVTNPPYGERLEGAPQLYREMGDAFRRLSRHRITVLSGSAELERAIRLKPSRMLIVFNGPIECRLLNYEVR